MLNRVHLAVLVISLLFVGQGWVEAQPHPSLSSLDPVVFPSPSQQSLDIRRDYSPEEATLVFYRAYRGRALAESIRQHAKMETTLRLLFEQRYNQDKNEALMAAIQTNQIRLVQLLLRRGADKNYEMGAALRLSRILGYNQIEDFLAQQGARVPLRFFEECARQTPRECLPVLGLIAPLPRQVLNQLVLRAVEQNDTPTVSSLLFSSSLATKAARSSSLTMLVMSASSKWTRWFLETDTVGLLTPMERQQLLVKKMFRSAERAEAKTLDVILKAPEFQLDVEQQQWIVDRMSSLAPSVQQMLYTLVEPTPRTVSESIPIRPASVPTVSFMEAVRRDRQKLQQELPSGSANAVSESPMFHMSI